MKLGLLPGAGGTQRVPRLAGVEGAISLMTTGNPINATKAAELSLVDRVVNGDDLVAQAVAYAEELVAANAPQKQARTAQITLTDSDRAMLNQ